jgi:two-component system, OmpR family, copper resistance phosphate regulon response regulator CusR
MFRPAVAGVTRPFDRFSPKVGLVIMHILIVEDEEKLASAVQKGLESEGYSVNVAFTGEEGFFLISNQSYDLLILDVMLPGRDGVEILTAVRKRGLSVPVLFLTAKDSIEDRVRGLDAGADDYLVKPFAFSELLARLRALTRRPQRTDVVSRLKLADLEMDVVGHSVTRDDRALVLTAREFDLLQYLLRHQGCVVSREMLARDIWKENARSAPLDSVIDVHIARLRRKLDEPFKAKLLHTVRGVGFIVRQEDVTSA